MFPPWTCSSLLQIAPEERVDQGIGASAADDEVRAEVSFLPEAGVLQNTARSDVVRLDECLYTLESSLGQGPRGDERDCTRGEATAARPRYQPVADLDGACLSSEQQDDESHCLIRTCVGDRQRQSLAVGPTDARSTRGLRRAYGRGAAARTRPDTRS